jgi:cysteinyl-tRNA synthetase
LSQDVAAALDDDLNAPRAVAAVFAYMNEGHAAMDGGDRPGPAALAAWRKVEGVLGVTSQVTIMKVEGDEPADESRELAETPPGETAAAERWALGWAKRRKEQKTARNFAEADRIRELLRAAGWEVRDKQDGSVEVVRIKRAS